MAKKQQATGTFILGKSMDDIREAYFNGKVDKLCADILAAGTVAPEGLQELTKALEGMKAEEDALRASLTAKMGPTLFPGVDSKPPTIGQLKRNMSDEELEAYAKWCSERDYCVRETRKIIKETAKSAMTVPKLDTAKLMNGAHAITGFLLYLTEDKNEKKTRLAERIINIIDEYGVSRREAQDRAEVTQEYLDYENAKDLELVANAFVMNAKKEFSGAGAY